MRKVVAAVISLVVVVLLCGPLQGFLFEGLGKSAFGALPVVSLPAEPLPIPWFGGEKMTNALLTTLLMDVLLILLLLYAFRHARRGEIGPPKGFLSNFIEALADVLANFAESVAGKRAKAIYPLVATLFFLVLLGNWFKLLPGAESIGVIETPHRANIPAYAPRHIQLGPLSFYTVDGTKRVEAAPPATEGEAHAASGQTLCTACNITPFIRGIATDLNFTLALALVTMTVVQVWGFRALGFRYLFKFINIPALNRGPIGIIEFLAGILEIISELSRVISFAFRLLGNIFAGTVLIFVMSNLVPFIVPVVFYGLELFVGLIQAAVFALLALVFINMATIGHADEGHGQGAKTAAAH